MSRPHQKALMWWYPSQAHRGPTGRLRRPPRAWHGPLLALLLAFHSCGSVDAGTPAPVSLLSYSGLSSKAGQASVDSTYT